MGIENIKTLLGFLIGIAHRADKVTAEDSAGGKKITGTEWLGSVTLLTGVPAVIRAIPELNDELNDLDDEERTELYEWVKEEFDISNDKLEAVIENAVYAGLYLFYILDLLKKD